MASSSSLKDFFNSLGKFVLYTTINKKLLEQKVSTDMLETPNSPDITPLKNFVDSVHIPVELDETEKEKLTTYLDKFSGIDKENIMEELDSKLFNIYQIKSAFSDSTGAAQAKPDEASETTQGEQGAEGATPTTQDDDPDAAAAAQRMSSEIVTNLIDTNTNPSEGGAWKKKKSGKKSVKRGGGATTVDIVAADAINKDLIYNVSGVVTSANDPLANAERGTEPLLYAYAPSSAGADTSIQLSTNTLNTVLPQTGRMYYGGGKKPKAKKEDNKKKTKKSK